MKTLKETLKQRFLNKVAKRQKNTYYKGNNTKPLAIIEADMIGVGV